VARGFTALSIEATVPCPSFRFQVWAANGIWSLCMAIGLCGTKTAPACIWSAED
jgi:hypothetical protein